MFVSGSYVVRLLAKELEPAFEVHCIVYIFSHLAAFRHFWPFLVSFGDFRHFFFCHF